MTQREVIGEYCRIAALVYHCIGDYTSPYDGFCSDCPLNNSNDYRNAGEVIEYVRRAVVEKLKADGWPIARGYNPVTGKDSVT